MQKELNLDKIKGHLVSVYWDIEDGDFKTVVVQDGDMLDRLDNNVAGRIDKNLKNYVIIFVSPVDRNNEYTPWMEESMSKNIDYFCGGGDEYLDLVFENILPTVEKKLKQNIRLENTYLAGASLGGLISLYALFEKPKLMGAIIVSPSMWYPHFIEYVKDNDIDLSDKKIYMDIGSDEDRALITNCSDPQQDFLDIKDLLLQKGLKSTNLKWEIKDDMDHKEVFFLDRIYNGMFFVLDKK